jgi:glycopeptide antibiotics resistance protein
MTQEPPASAVLPAERNTRPSPENARRRRPVARPLLAAAIAAYLAFIGWLTLGPQPYDPSAVTVLDRVLALLRSSPVTAWITFDVVEFSANVALFVPLAALLVLLLGLRRRWLVLALSVALTCAIELAQGAWLPTRVSDPRDVLANSAGAALGIALVLTARLLLPRGAGRRVDGGSPA